MDTSCIFCAISQKLSPANILFENDYVVAFLDIDPVSEGHTLVIPKAHFDDLLDIDQDSLGHVMHATKLLVDKIYHVLQPDGINILQNTRSTPGRHIVHFHINIIPRHNSDGIKMFYAEIPPQEDLFMKLQETTNKLKF